MRCDTDFRGGGSRFPEGGTELAQSAQTDHKGRREEAIALISERFWMPLFAFAFRRWRDREWALDLAQGFFEKAVLEPRYLRRFDRNKGTFKAFFLGSFVRYARHCNRKRKAQKRSPGSNVVSLDRLHELGREIPAPTMTAEDCYEKEWFRTRIRYLAEQMQEQLIESNRSVDWELFRARFLAPWLDGDPPVPLKVLCERFGIDRDWKITLIVQPLERRFLKQVGAMIRKEIGPKADLQEEIGRLLRLFSR